ncbi:septum formation family protein [Kutzneria buriramensis]|uniref:Putative regulator of septum formation n=1 Tax=Kutzneria buriramensis TaxID=1045776 RepID=A0A3E0HTN4_9PSEU|nr:septum formation family protein [Kutzneria buriramensis]REH49778.1 putative regulator of septum formation [Kutzneria buriramensis]
MVRRGWLAVIVLALGLVSACGRPAADPAARLTATPSSPSNSAGLAPVPMPQVDSGGVSRDKLPAVGDCIDADHKTVACTTPHQGEVTLMGDLPDGLPDALPDDTTMTRSALPPCRDSLADYLKSKDADATDIQAWAFWPQADAWTKGERWLVCAATQIDSAGNPVTMTGSLRDGLAGGGFARYQTCTVSSPSRDETLRFGPCDKPHLGEAMPGVQALGRSTDAMPATDVINQIARNRCSSELASYLGTSSRTDVTYTWRAPDTRQAWAQGYTNLICYAEAARSVGARLQGIGNGPLPR